MRYPYPGAANGKAMLVTRPLAAGERSEVSPSRNGSASTGAHRRSPEGRRNLVMSDPEVPAKPKRRQFTAEYKLSILEQVDTCQKYGEIAALLRREGLYDSHLTLWRKQRAAGTLVALGGKKRGRPEQPVDPLAPRVAELERENARLQKRLHQAETIIAVQKKISELLGIRQPNEPKGKQN